LSKPRRKWDDIIENDSQEMACGRMDCIGLGQDREIWKLGGKSSLSRPRRKWDNIIEIDLQAVCCERMTASVCVRIGNWEILEERDH